MKSYTEPQQPSPAKQAFASYAARASWLFLLGGIPLSLAIANGYGMEWGHGLTVGYKALLTTTTLALLCASIAIYGRSKSRDYLAFVLSVLLLLLLIILAMNARVPSLSK